MTGHTSRRHLPYMALAFLVASAIILNLLTPARAQQELLSNNKMEQYYGIGGANVAPIGWTLTSSVPVNSSRQNWTFNEFPGFDVAWAVSASYATFSMTASQFVPGVREGTPLKFTIYSNVFTCDKQTSCIEEGKPRASDKTSNARTRIGIDPKGGSDPNAASVIWSSYISPFDQFLPATVETKSQNNNGVTLFLNATQDKGMLLNIAYWDNASLTVAGAGGGGVVGGNTPATEVPRVVPYVTPQGMQPDGSIIHIVSVGDTLASISVAYKVPVDEIRALNNIPQDEFVIQIGQKLLIRGPQPMITYVIVTASYTPGGPTITPGPTTRTATPSPSATRSGPVTPTRTPAIIIITLPPSGMGESRKPLRRVPPRDVKQAQNSAGNGSLCVSAFQDADASGHQNGQEGALEGLVLVLNGADGEPLRQSTRSDSPACFNNLAAGGYKLMAEAPIGYRLTDPAEIQVQIREGDKMQLAVGAVAGEGRPAAPGAALLDNNAAPSWATTLSNNIGVLFLALAVMVLGGGFMLARRISR
jgi:LysM repeat protein